MTLMQSHVWESIIIVLANDFFKKLFLKIPNLKNYFMYKGKKCD